MKRLIGLLGLVLAASAVQADSVTTIQLENRPAAEVIPIVEPLLGEDDAISGQGFKIFLRSSPRTQARIRAMIEALDTPAKVLQVSVFQGSERDLGRLGVDASVQIDRGDVSVEVGNDDREETGGGVTYSTTDGSVSAGAVRTEESLRDTPIHQVRVTEGTEAYIETGQRIPYFYGAAFRGPRAFAGGIEYEDAMTGFYVLPRVRGDNVVLEVSPYKSSRTGEDKDNVDVQSATTTVIGRIGEWILVGGVTRQLEQTQGVTGSKLATQGSSNSGIWIKADLIR